MSVTIEYKEGIFYVVHGPSDKRMAFFPKDGQLAPASPVIGFDYVNGKFVPISCTPEGKLDTTATLTGTITIGSVRIEDRDSATLLDIIKGDGTAIFGAAGDHNQGLLAFGVDEAGAIRPFRFEGQYLKVRLDQDIQIGAVELKDKDADLRAKINTLGALSIDDSIMQKQNMTTELTYVAAGNPGEGQVATLTEYPTGAPGTKKLSTFTYNTDDKVSKIEVTTI